MRKNQRNFYRILHVQPDAPEEIISSSYRTLMQRLKCHPDLGGDESHAALINEAYSTISNPYKRDQYDRAINNVLSMRVSDNQINRPKVATGQSGHEKQAHRVHLNHCLFCHEPHYFGVNIPIDAQCRQCSSPLSAIEKPLLKTPTGRNAERVANTQRLHFYTQWPLRTKYTGVVQNVSLSGALFSANQHIEKNAYLKVACDTFNGVGQVVHCEKNKKPASSWSVRVIFRTLSFSELCGSFISLKV